MPPRKRKQSIDTEDRDGKKKKADAKKTSASKTKSKTNTKSNRGGQRSGSPKEDDVNLSRGLRLRSGRSMAAPTTAPAPVQVEVSAPDPPTNSAISASRPRPRPRERPSRSASPDSWDGFSIARNRERARRRKSDREARPVPQSQTPMQQPAAAASDAAGDNGQEADEAHNAAGENREMNVDQSTDTDTTGNNTTPSAVVRQNSLIAQRNSKFFETLVAAGLDPFSPEDQSYARNFIDQLRRSQLSSPPTSSFNADAEPEDPLNDASTRATPSGPDLPEEGEPEEQEYDYNFYDGYSVYPGGPLEEGTQTAVDRLSKYRFKSDDWKPIPLGFCVPRLDNFEEHERDAERLEAKDKEAEKGSKVGRGGKGEGREDKGGGLKGSEGKDTNSMMEGIEPEAPEPALVSESDLSGSNYSETQRDIRRRWKNGHRGPAPDPTSDDPTSESGEDSAMDAEPTPTQSRPKASTKAATKSANQVVGPSSTPSLTSSNAKAGRPNVSKVEKISKLKEDLSLMLENVAEDCDMTPSAVRRACGEDGPAVKRSRSRWNDFLMLEGHTDEGKELKKRDKDTFTAQAAVKYNAIKDNLDAKGLAGWSAELAEKVETLAKKNVTSETAPYRMKSAKEDLTRTINHITRFSPDIRVGGFLLYMGSDPRARLMETFVTAGEDVLGAIKTGSFSVDKLLQMLGNAIRAERDNAFIEAEGIAKPSRKKKNEVDKAEPRLRERDRLDDEILPEDLINTGEMDQGLRRIRRLAEGVRLGNISEELDVVDLMKSVKIAYKSNENDSCALVRKQVVFVLLMNLNALRNGTKFKKAFPFAHFLTTALERQLRMVGWPGVTLGLPPGAGFNSQDQHVAVWQAIRRAIENGHLRLEYWSQHERNLSPDSMEYGEIALVRSLNDDVLVKASDVQKKSGYRSKSKARSETATEGKEAGAEDIDDEMSLDDIHVLANHTRHVSTQPSTTVQEKGKEKGTEDAKWKGKQREVLDDRVAKPAPPVERRDDVGPVPSRMPPLSDFVGYRIVNDEYIRVGARDLQREQERLPEIAVVTRGDSRVEGGEGQHSRQFIPARRGEMGAQQYRRFIVDESPATTQYASRPIMPPTRQHDSSRRPSDESQHGGVRRSSGKQIQQPERDRRVPAPHFYNSIPPGPPLRHPGPQSTSRVPPTGQPNRELEPRGRVAESNFTSRMRQDLPPPPTHRYYRQRRVDEAQDGPSHEVFLTVDEDLQRREEFALDAYNAVDYYED